MVELPLWGVVLFGLGALVLMAWLVTASIRWLFKLAAMFTVLVLLYVAAAPTLAAYGLGSFSLETLGALLAAVVVVMVVLNSVLDL